MYRPSSLRVRDRDERRPEQAVAQEVTPPHDLDACRLRHVRRTRVRHRLVQCRIERVADITERGQAELAQRRRQLIGDGRERPDQIAVIASPIQIIEYGQQRVSTAPVACSATSVRSRSTRLR